MWIKDDKNIRSFHSTFQEGLINHWNASPVPVNLTLVFKMNNAAPHYSLSKTCLHFYNLPPFIFFFFVSVMKSCYQRSFTRRCDMLSCFVLLQCNNELLFDYAEKAIDLLKTKPFCNN